MLCTIFRPSVGGPHLDDDEIVLAVRRVAAVADVRRRPRVHHDDALAQVLHRCRPQAGPPEVQALLRALMAIASQKKTELSDASLSRPTAD